MLAIKFHSKCSRVRSEHDKADIITGAHDILELTDLHSSPAKLYLGDKIFPVPKWMYKVVKSPSGIVAFVNYNNVFHDEAAKPAVFCNEVACPIQLKDSATAGFTYCCDLKSLEKAVGHKLN